MEYLRFPAWQSFCIDAVKEFDPPKFLALIERAEAAVLQRSMGLEKLPDARDNDERLAIVDALKSLRFLKTSVREQGTLPKMKKNRTRNSRVSSSSNPVLL
ncbi:MAG TPA: hypothetical protein VIH76_01080 [Candidatus Acidoferrales bacterium]